MSTTGAKISSIIEFLKSFLYMEGSYFGKDFGSATAYERAEQENLQVVLPKDNELFIDIDNEFAFAIFEKHISTIYDFYALIGTYTVRPSKSGGERKHITVTLEKPIEPIERLLLQAFLGSDLKREFLGLQRIKINDPHPTLFLEKKKSDLSISL